jgi:hypothetical protein
MLQTRTTEVRPLIIPPSDASEAFLERLWLDHQLVTKLLLNRDIAQVIKEEGFELDESFMPWVELSVKKIRTYITDQIHFMQAKRNRNPGYSSSGNGSVDW